MISGRKDWARLAPLLPGILAVAVLLGCSRRETDSSAPRAEAPSEAAKQSGQNPMPNQASEDPAGHRNSTLPVYGLRMDAREVAELERTAHSDQTHPAVFISGNKRYENARVRYRGAWSRSWPKKPLKVFFDHDDSFEKHRSMNFNSAWRDPAYIREPLAYYVYAACGVPAPRAQMAKIELNGQFRGIYVEVEQPDKTLLTRFDLKGASIFKAVSRSNQADERELGSEDAYAAHYEKESQKPEGMRDLQVFCRDLAHATNVLEFFNAHVDLDRYISYLAATVLVQHWDGFNKNHFLLYDGRGSKKWFVIPWDLDRTFGDHWDTTFDQTHLPIALGTHQLPGITGWNRLEDRFFSEPRLRARFLDRLQELLEKEFTPEKLFPIVDQMETQIADDVPLDKRRWPGGGGSSDLRRGTRQVKKYIEERRTFLLGEVSKLRRDPAFSTASK